MGEKIEGDAGRNFNVFCMCTLGRHRRDFGQVDNSERAPVFFTVQPAEERIGWLTRQLELEAAVLGMRFD